MTVRRQPNPTQIANTATDPEQSRGRGRPSLTADQLAARRESVADAARALFATEGYGAVSMRRVADAAGVTPKTVYSYFDSKIDLLRGLWSDIFRTVFGDLDRIAEQDAHAPTRLAAVCTAYVRYWVDHPDHYRLVFMSSDVSQPSVSVFLESDDVAARFAVFATCFAAASHGASPAAVRTSSELLVCALHGIAHNHITISGYPWQPPETLTEVLVRSLLLATGLTAGLATPTVHTTPGTRA